MKLLFVDQTANHNPHSGYQVPKGGALTSLTEVPEYLAKQGHEVFVFSSHKVQETHNLVQYITDFANLPQLDAAVFNRNVLPYELVKKYKDSGTKIVWWLHDIVDPRVLPDDAFKMADLIIAQSEYCKKTYCDFYELDPQLFAIISNGVHSELFDPGDHEKRNPNLYITASALIKGFLPLDLCYMNLKRHNPDLDFRIYSSQKLHGFENTPQQTAFLDQMSGAGAHVYSPMSPTSLAAVMKKAWCLLMPNSYPEMCSNLLLQARACGLPIVSSSIGANPEFLEHEKTGLLTKYHPHDIHSWTKEFTELACKLYFDKDLHKQISHQTIKNVPTWESVGNEWNTQLLKLVTNKLQNVEVLEKA